MSKQPRKQTVFQDNWLSESLFSSWLIKMPLDNKIARCKLCQKNFNLSNMGRRALTSHMNGEKHIRTVRASKQSASIGCFLNSKEKKSSDEPPVIPSSSSNTIMVLPVQETESASERGLKSFLLNDSVTKAEILWAIESVMTHSSLRGAARDVTLFQTMFPDSNIAQKMQLQKDKIGYSLAYGIAPFFERELLEKVNESDFIVIGFDESLNKVAQKQQMDVNVRFWDELQGEVKTRYLTSIFLGRSRAVDLFNAFKEKISSIVSLQKILQISMDGPNVNFKFLKDFKQEMNAEPENKKLLDLGSCGLHTLHCAFKTAMIETGWDIVGFLRALYNLFKDSPARRTMFTNATNLTTFPKKFCAVRWLQNAEVAQRALDLLPSVKIFVEEAQKEKNISSQSFKTVVKHMSDPLLAPKLEFFKGLANDVEPFLEKFQNDEPLAPFLYNELTALIETQMHRCVKSQAITEVQAVKDVKLLEKNLLPANEIKIGIVTTSAISKANKSYGKMKDAAILQFRESCKRALVHFVSKMLDKSPLQYKLTRAISCFDPKIVGNKQVSKMRMELLLTILLESSWLSSSIIDKIMREYENLVSQPGIISVLEKYTGKPRLDHFWRDLIGDGRPNLLKLLKLVCSLSHGNAHVERGFSVNKECIVENMTEELLIARRGIFDKLISIGGINNLHIGKPLIHAARNSYSRYLEARDAKKKKEDELAVKERNKRQASMHVKELLKKKAKILEEAQRQTDLLNEEIKSLKQA